MYPTVVTAEWLLDNLHNSNLQIFDVSFFEGLSLEQAKHQFGKTHIQNSFQLLLCGKDFSRNFFTKVPRLATMT